MREEDPKMMNRRPALLCLSGTAMLALTGPALAADPSEVLVTYADIAEAGYADSLAAAQQLDLAVQALITSPSEDTLAGARRAWLAARAPYQQTEVFRFGNPIVDEWEGRVNAWPLDEGLIDYVDGETYGGASEENEYRALNVIANPRFELAGEEIDATAITPALLQDVLQEADENEANVATGYHAIEFLLWGQDLNGTGPGAGQRPYTDYAAGDACTNGNCDRRAAYLQAATSLLITDLTEMAEAWGPEGAARAEVLADEGEGLTRILTGMGSLSYGELAGERTKLGLMLNDPEEEHDCFSDNTHMSHYYDGLGIRNVYLGSYTRIDGSVVEGPSLSDLVAAADSGTDAAVRSDLDRTMTALEALVAKAKGGMSYDMMLAPGNDEGAATITAVVDGLVNQTRGFQRAVDVLGTAGVTVEGSDSLDNPSAVFH